MKYQLTPIHKVVAQFAQGLDKDDLDRMLEATYAFCLDIENHHYLNRRLKDLGFDQEIQREFKAVLKYSRYAKCDFWRGVVFYLRWFDLAQAQELYRLDEEDLETCFEVLTNEQHIRLLQIAPFKSISRVSEAELQMIITKAGETCCRVADRQLRWIEKVDPSFSGREELHDEAIRVANFYAHFPDTSRILSYVIRAVYNRANHLCEYHSADVRRRQRKLPELICRECSSQFIHRKKVHTLSDMLASGFTPGMMVRYTAGPEPSVYYCPKCAQSGVVTGLETIEGERDYETLVVSLDHPGTAMEGGRSFADKLPDKSTNVERDVQQSLDLSIVTRKLKVDTADFVRILVEGDEQFEAWARSRDIQALDDPLVVAHLICEFKDLPYEDIKREVGRVIGIPSVFLVRVDGEDDLVCAHTNWEAVHTVARQYKYSDGHAMQQDLGEVMVRKVADADGSVRMGVGDVMPVEG